MVLIDTQMYFTEPQTEVFEINDECIVMDFISCNNIETQIDQLENEKYLKQNTHNIFYTTKYKGTYKIPAFEKVNYLSIVQGDNAVRHTILIDKSKNVIFQQKDLLNDIDGMDFNRSPWSYTDDAIVFLDHTSRFLPKFKNRNELEDSPSKRKLEEFVKKNEEKLNDDYWVLAKYKFKDLNLK